MPALDPLDPQEVLGVHRQRLPRHIAIIMDGNGRWARQRGLPRLEGHRRGAVSVREVVTQSARLGIEYLTLYSFSLENWKRPREEVEFLMDLYAAYLVQERDLIMENDIRLAHVGHREGLPQRVTSELDKTIELSKNNRGMMLGIALNYGSRAELLHAIRSIARDVAAGRLGADDIDERHVSDRLFTAGMADPDLLIRTAGERRLSNFLLWQISYAELYVTDLLWPDFRRQHLNEAIKDYASRERRFGALPTAKEHQDPPAVGATKK
jgi:undecaprenyl diphosphate synthase